MSTVLTKLDAEPLDETCDFWVLNSPYVVVSDTLGRIEIPTGFVSDFNSVPWLLTNILPKIQHPAAAWPHDFLYQKGELNGVKVQRIDADRVHREFLIWGLAAPWKVAAMYDGLRLGGWVPWRKYRKADAIRKAAKGV